jgi:hypothetical protein
VKSSALQGPGAAIIEDRFLEKSVVENFDHFPVAAKPGGSERFPNIAPGYQLHTDVRCLLSQRVSRGKSLCGLL